MTKSQIRQERRERSHSRKKRRRMVFYVGGGVLAVIFIASLTLAPGLGGGHGGSSTSTTAQQAGLNTGGPVPQDGDDGSLHVGTGETHSAYSFTPATSGPHWFQSDTPAGVPSPARWGTYEFEIPDEVLIHNLEHGGIGVHYNCGLAENCDTLVQQLEDLIPRNPSQYIMSPYSSMDQAIAITAWRHHLFLDEYDEDAVIDFIDAYIDRGPESVPGNSF